MTKRTKVATTNVAAINVGKNDFGLSIPGKLTPTGWQLPKDMPEDQWIGAGVFLQRIEGAVQWWLGDWWAYGEHKYGARKALFEEGGPFGDMNRRTVEDYGWVAQNVKTTERSVVLKWYHHRCVADLPPPQQRKWLALAVKEEWSSNQLKAAITREVMRGAVVPTTATIVRASCLDWLPKQPDCDLLLTDPVYSTDVADIDAFAKGWLPVALAKVKRTGRAYVCIGAYRAELVAYLRIDPPPHLMEPQKLTWTYRNTLGPSPTHSYKLNEQAILYYCGADAPPLNCPEMIEQFSVQDINAPDGRQGDRWHAWQKPDELAERFVRHASKPGDLILDPFAGSGTFILSAAKLGRIARGCDVNAEMVTLAKTRGCLDEGQMLEAAE